MVKSGKGANAFMALKTRFRMTRLALLEDRSPAAHARQALPYLQHFNLRGLSNLTQELLMELRRAFQHN